ncbi:MAG: anion permease [Lachnospiraceae bacterium]|nr:anion permease [Lachnospiraceae bacterium]
MLKHKRRINLVVGPLLMILFTFFLPASIFAEFKSRAAVGTVAWMAYWWVTGPIDYAVTAFLPIAINAVLQITDMKDVIANYASETILLLLGASIMMVSWEETGLDKRIASRFLMTVGSGFRTQLVFWFLLSTFLSTVLPNAVVCATITPIAVSMLKYAGEKDIAESSKGSKLLLYVAYGTGVGGLASPLGGAMNLVTISYLEEITGQEYIYINWVLRFLPIMLLLLLVNIIFMLRDVPKHEVLGRSKEYFEKECRNLPPMKPEEKWSLAMFIIATVLSFTRQLYQDILPGLKPAYVFIIFAILSFLIKKEDGKTLLRWRFVQTRIVWELLYIFAGGLAVGTLISGSGATENIGTAISGMGMKGGFVTILVIITVTVLMSDVTSNTATAAVAMPIVISIIQGIGKNPIPYIYIASIGVNLSYMLPTSIRAVPVGYGLRPNYMLREGWKMTIVVIAAMTLISWALLTYWPAFSTV